ncbi:hypothetical protein BLNAU_2131 [Blattamonas nauphoetae]|uniref:Protein kinase domain-containing protein n=1 Tax=Blattamonas nauphoetae TaxID=2049346 RepID=A0ABQ9YH75_9EUKA|nr:hypothetical protein BLNAU_2131 [Blattamonas nauphoetae]
MFCVFQHTFATSSNSLQPHRVATSPNTKTSAIDLESVFRPEWNTDGSTWKDIDVFSITEGTYIGNDIEITHRTLELSGEGSSGKNSAGTRIITFYESYRNRSENINNMQAVDRSLFFLTNSTLSLKSILFSLVEDSAEGRKQKNEARSPRLAIVSSSMLMISSSRIEVSPWTSAIVISPSTLEESGRESSVVISKSLLWNDVGSMRGIVETSSFASLVGSVWVSIVGCSFDSSRILGNDGIGLSLTQAPRKNVESVGRLSSSLIGCSFVNMSSIGCLHSPRLPHLDQKMLGCVVSLTSSHLSGSTIRDVSSGGSVLCSNSSFSSLLSSPNTDSDTDSSDGTVKLPSGATEPFKEGKTYNFGLDDGTSSVVFSSCRFTGAKYPYGHALIVSLYPGAVFIESCSFENIPSRRDGGAVEFLQFDQYNDTYLTVTSTNFTNCSSTWSGGAIYADIDGDLLINSCRFENCSAEDCGGGLSVDGSATDGRSPFVQIVDCVFADCTATGYGGGVIVDSDFNLSLFTTKFERCESVSGSLYSDGGGISGYTGKSIATVDGCHFIECNASIAGGAMYHSNTGNVNISDTLVKNCESGTTGAICFTHYSDAKFLSVSHVFFDGNSVGDDTTFKINYNNFMENMPKFTDIAIICTLSSPLPTLGFGDCYTTTSSDSIGMVIGVTELSSGKYDPERFLADEFNIMGPFLTAKPTVQVNEKTGKIELEMMGNTPLPSQEYEVTVKDSDGTETILRMLFSGGTGTLVSPSEVNLQYNTSYTITSIVGVVPDSSSSRLTNDIEVPVAAWAFNLVATPDFLTFTTPKEPIITTPDTPSFSTLQDATAHLIESNPKSAFVVLHFDNEVCGSFDFVVFEEGNPVTLTLNSEGCSKSGGTKEFKVIGDGKLLTHDTTYTIKSLTPTPNTDSPTDVWMNDTITFHIPKSSYIPPEEPEELEDPKKALSPETKKLLSWLLPLIGCLLIALVLAIIIIVLLRRRQKKNAFPTQTEMEAQEPIDIEKVEEFGLDDRRTRGLRNRMNIGKDVEQAGMDGLRWRAPEVVSADGRSGVESVDGHKASVFSLGLVLWEIETGQVPFGELDAVNAQRQSGTGVGPKMDTLKNEEFISLIHRCLSVDPKQRPTLSEIGEFLSSHSDKNRVGSGMEMKE